MIASQVRDAVRVCRACNLFKVAHGPVPFVGDAPNFLAVLGGASTKDDDEHGEPFSGKAGDLLRELMTEAGIDPSSTSFINSVACFGDRPPVASEVSACSTNVLAQLQIVNPVWVLLLGSVALTGQRPDLLIGRTRGKVLQHGTPWKFFVAHSPTHALRDKSVKETLRQDLLLLTEMLDAEAAGWVSLTDDSCAQCGSSIMVIADKGGGLRFDDWGVPYCTECFGKAPMIVAADKSQKKIDRVHEQTGLLFK